MKAATHHLPNTSLDGDRYAIMRKVRGVSNCSDQDMTPCIPVTIMNVLPNQEIGQMLWNPKVPHSVQVPFPTRTVLHSKPPESNSCIPALSSILTFSFCLCLGLFCDFFSSGYNIIFTIFSEQHQLWCSSLVSPTYALSVLRTLNNRYL